MNIDKLTRRIARGSGIVFAGSIVGKIVSFVLQILLSRGLGAAIYGVYNLGVSVLRFGREIGGLGLQGGLVRFGAEAHGRGNQAQMKGTILSGLAIGGGVGVVLGVGLFLASDWLAETAFSDAALAPVLRAFSVALPFYVLTYLASRAARGLQNMQADVTIGVVLHPTVNVVGVALAFALGYGLDGVVVAFIASTVVSASVGLYLLTRLFPPLLSGLSPEFQVRSLLRFSLPVLGAGLATLLLDQADRIMLGIFATTADVGLYHAAALAATQVRFVLTAVNATFTPVISDLYHRGETEALHRLFRTTTRWIVTLSLPLALVLVLFPEPILWFFGPEFTDGATMLTVLAVAVFIDGSVGASGLMLQMSDHETLAFANNVVLAILNVVLNAWLIVEMGPVGAAIATGTSIALVNVLKLAQVRYFLQMHPFEAAFGKPFLAGGLATFGGWGTSTLLAPWSGHWVVGVGVLGLIYLAVLAALGLSDDDWTVLTPLLRKVGIPVQEG